MKKINRREFLKASVGTAVALGTPSVFTPTRVHAKKIDSHVAAIRGDKLDSMTRDAIAALGGMKTFVNKGEKVFIKPNFVSFPWAQYNNCFHVGECTKPEIIIAATEECLKAGAAEVIIGDGSHFPSFDWKYAVTLDGSTNLVKEAKRLSSLYSGNVTLACLETDSPGWVDISSKSSPGKIAISSLVAKADKVISIPVAKTHCWAHLTLAAKNFVGVISLTRHGQLRDNTWWNRDFIDHSSPAAIAQIYLDIVKSTKPVLSIIDFSIGIEGNGPTQSWGGTTMNMKNHIGSWAILASPDIMAADATAARIMNHDTNKAVHLAIGHKMGLGEIREPLIKIVGEKLDNLRSTWKPARIRN